MIQPTTHEEKIAQLEAQLRWREDEIALLREAVAAISSEMKLDVLLDLIAKQAQSLIQAETVLIPVVNHHANEYSYRAGVGKNVEEIVGESLPLEFGLCGWVWRHKRPWWRGSVAQLSPQERKRWEKEEGTVILVPLIGRKQFVGGIVGIVKCNSGGVGDSEGFTENDLHVLELFAGQAAFAIENANAMEEINLARLAAEAVQRELQMLNKQLALSASVFSATHDAVTITDATGNIIDVNDAFTRITGYNREESIGRNPRFLQSGRQSHEFYRAMWESIQKHGYWSGEIWNRRKDGMIYPEMLTISSMKDDQSRVLNYVAVASDITAIKNHQVELERIAHFDALTGVPNRVLLADRMHQAIAQTDRNRGLLAICYFDLDGFKLINDRFGHDIGDVFLVEIAERVTSCLRGGDTIARLGGDEFVLLLQDLNDTSTCEQAVDRILAEIRRPVTVQGEDLSISASMGVTLYPNDDSDPDTLLRHADQAMYRAKQEGKNQSYCFSEDMDQHGTTRRQSLLRISNAIKNDELVLHYQPKVNMRRGLVMGAEALVRWQHPERGLLPPGDFLPLIDDHDLIIDLGDWVIERVLKQMSIWHAQGLDLVVSINTAARQLHHPDFFAKLQASLAAHPELPPGRLELEILETTALVDMAYISNLINNCRKIGVQFSLDDFGTGYSSLTYLRHLPVDSIKIDQSFIRNMLSDPEDLAIVHGVVGLAEVFNRTVVAEGVETVEHGVMLLNLGCDLAQGYGIARPMPANNLWPWIQSWIPYPNWLPSGGYLASRDDLHLIIAEHEHERMVKEIIAMANGKAAKRPKTLGVNNCRFGMWYEGIGLARYWHLTEYAQMGVLHRDLHRIGLEIVELVENRRLDEARARIRSLIEAKEKFISGLIQLGPILVEYRHEHLLTGVLG
jgi:diguanylate cyclase (GGDEF)-like protein/PAS domain S-box-containing protein